MPSFRQDIYKQPVIKGRFKFQKIHFARDAWIETIKINTISDIKTIFNKKVRYAARKNKNILYICIKLKTFYKV